MVLGQIPSITQEFYLVFMSLNPFSKYYEGVLKYLEISVIGIRGYCSSNDVSPTEKVIGRRQNRQNGKPQLHLNLKIEQDRKIKNRNAGSSNKPGIYVTYKVGAEELLGGRWVD